MSTKRRSSLQKQASEADKDGRRMSHTVKTYQLDKCLDPKQLDKIIYQAGLGYSQATTSQRQSGGEMSFDIDGFATYLKHSRCLGVLLFWKEAEEYLNMFSQKERAACAQKIFQRYLKAGTEYEINLTGINDGTVKSMESKLGNPPEDLFEEAQRLAYQQMSLELFPRFWDAVKAQTDTAQAITFTENATLKSVLGDEKQVLLFSEYCKMHLCEEQILFWLEAKDHKLLFDPNDMLQFGQRLYLTYIDMKTAEARINVSDVAAKDVEAKLATGKVDRDLFNECSTQVETFLELDLWPRYKDAVISGTFNPAQGKVNIIDQQGHMEEDDNPSKEVDMTKPSKAAVKKILLMPANSDEVNRMKRAAEARQSAEMIEYCRDCQEYTKLFSNEDRMVKATAMIKKYLTAGCDMPVNIPDTQVKAIQKNADAPDATIFKKSYEECVKLLSENVYTVYLEEVAKDEEAKKAAQISAPAAGSAPAKGGGGGGGGCCIIS